MRDVFGGIGIDAITASRALNIAVFVTERDSVTFQCLCRNIISQDASRVIADHRDGREQPFLTELVYLDPPWGNDYLPGRPFDFFGVFGELIQSEARWCRFLIVKTPFFLGATRAPWKPIYAYCSRKYRIIMWVFDVTSEGNFHNSLRLALLHTGRVNPPKAVDEQHSAHDNKDGYPGVGEMTAQEPLAGALNDEPK